MKPEAQRIAIAEACGWKASPHCPDYGNPPWGVPPTPKTPARPWEELPNYPNDLNAMHEAEKTLGARDWKYVEELKKLSDDDWSYHWTAAHRAEAFLRTIGKWEESE